MQVEPTRQERRSRGCVTERHEPTDMLRFSASEIHQRTVRKDDGPGVGEISEKLDFGSVFLVPSQLACWHGSTSAEVRTSRRCARPVRPGDCCWPWAPALLTAPDGGACRPGGARWRHTVRHGTRTNRCRTRGRGVAVPEGG